MTEHRHRPRTKGYSYWPSAIITTAWVAPLMVMLGIGGFWLGRDYLGAQYIRPDAPRGNRPVPTRILSREEAASLAINAEESPDTSAVRSKPQRPTPAPTAPKPAPTAVPAPDAPVDSPAVEDPAVETDADAPTPSSPRAPSTAKPPRSTTPDDEPAPRASERPDAAKPKSSEKPAKIDTRAKPLPTDNAPIPVDAPAIDDSASTDAPGARDE